MECPSPTCTVPTKCEVPSETMARHTTSHMVVKTMMVLGPLDEGQIIQAGLISNEMISIRMMVGEESRKVRKT